MGRPTSPLIDAIAGGGPGSKVVLVQGDHFEGKPEIFRANMIHALKRRGVKCKTHVSGTEIHITITEDKYREWQ